MASAMPGEPSPAHDTESAVVREQLERILASAVFRTSPRYSSLLRHVVERTLNGHPEELKERTIGIDVFARAADYDTNTDRIVRTAAGEVRRRLAQYYMEPGREAEIRIDLLPGSYVPQFRPAADRAGFSAPSVDEPPAQPPLRKWRLAAIGAAVLAVLLSLVAAMRMGGPGTSVERFWNPVFASGSPVLLYVGGGGPPGAAEKAGSLSVRDFDRLPSRSMHTSDALALAGLAALLQSNGRPYRILNREAATSFQDLQSGPLVLICGMNNEWMLRLTGSLRFGFERLPNGARVLDRQNPANGDWSVDLQTPIAQFTRDYAIVSRFRDPKTGQIAVVVAGIGSWGTLAGSEFVISPEYIRKLEANAPRRWDRKNLQVVISTDVIRGSSGPLNVLATHFW
jgi:hypothetical protein